MSLDPWRRSGPRNALPTMPGVPGVPAVQQEGAGAFLHLWAPWYCAWSALTLGYWAIAAARAGDIPDKMAADALVFAAALLTGARWAGSFAAAAVAACTLLLVFAAAALSWRMGPGHAAALLLAGALACAVPIAALSLSMRRLAGYWWFRALAGAAPFLTLIVEGHRFGLFEGDMGAYLFVAASLSPVVLVVFDRSAYFLLSALGIPALAITATLYVDTGANPWLMLSQGLFMLAATVAVFIMIIAIVAVFRKMLR